MKRPVKNYCAYIDKGLRLNFLSDDQDQLLASVRPCCNIHANKIGNDHKKYVPIKNTTDLIKHPTRKHFQKWFGKEENWAVLHPACISLSLIHI